MYDKVKALFNHPGYDLVSGMMALAVIVFTGAWVVLDAYGQIRGHKPVVADPNLAILGGLPVAHFFGRISRHFHKPDDKSYIVPSPEIPGKVISVETPAPVKTDDQVFSAV